VRKELAALSGVDQVSADASESFSVESGSGADLREAVFELAVRRHWPILELQQKSLSLEEIFRTLTK
jgi:hypothetical protein